MKFQNIFLVSQNYRNDNPIPLYIFRLRPAESQAIQWSLPLHDHLPLTQYIATSGKKKREAEYNPDDLSSGSKKKREAEFNVDDLALQSRIFNVSAVSYSSDDLVWQYLRYGAATALLLGLAATLPSPDSPILPINLPSNRYVLKKYMLACPLTKCPETNCP